MILNENLLLEISPFLDRIAFEKISFLNDNLKENYENNVKREIKRTSEYYSTLYYGDNEKICFEFIFSALVKDGKCIKLKSSGLLEKSNYLNDIKHGECIEYADNRIISKGSYNHGKKEGEHVEYQYFVVGRRTKIMNFSNNILHGEFLEYNVNDKLICLKNYAFGVENGKSFHYDHDDNIIMTNYLNGKPYGESITFDENSKIKRKRSFINEKLVQKYEEFYHSGKLKVSAYSIGDPQNNLFCFDGEYLGYNENGTLWFRGNYVFGEKHGEAIYYDDEGNIRNREYHFGGGLSQRLY